MKIGIFDSGLGGLVIAKSIIDRLPPYDYLYLGDTARVPYGDRSSKEVYRFTEEAVSYLLQHDCKLVIIACNTASAEALRKIQQEYLPTHFPDRKVLGVIIPTVEEALSEKRRRIGILATNGTVQSETYVKEIHKIDPLVEVFQLSSPLLVPAIEAGDTKTIEHVLGQYIDNLIKHNVHNIILGCTHYALVKDVARKLAGTTPIISQDEIIPSKLEQYLKKHTEIENVLLKNFSREYQLTKMTDGFSHFASQLFREPIYLVVITGLGQERRF